MLSFFRVRKESTTKSRSTPTAAAGRRLSRVLGLRHSLPPFEEADLKGSTKYTLPRDSTETQRLEDQHYIFKAMFKGQLLHPAIQVPSDAAVLDSATGSTVWLRDVAAMVPQIKTFRGFDVSPLQFPQSNIISPHGVPITLDLFLHDVTKPLPTEHHNRYDLVHQRLLVLGLQAAEWPTAVANLAQALKPGGWLQLVDSSYCGFEAVGTNWAVQQANFLIKLVCEVGDKDTALLDHIPTYFEEVGLESIQVQTQVIQLGASNENPDEGQRFNDWACRALLGIWRAAYEIPSARERLPESLNTIEKAEARMQEVNKYWTEHGGSLRMSMMVGRKKS